MYFKCIIFSAIDVSLPQQPEVLTQKLLKKCHTTSVTPVRQLIRVTPVSGHPRSILLPVSLKDVKDIKTIKIINTSSPTIRKQTGVSNVCVTTSNRITLPTKPILVKSTVPLDDVTVTSSVSEETGDESDSQYPKLQLTRKFVTENYIFGKAENICFKLELKFL